VVKYSTDMAGSVGDAMNSLLVLIVRFSYSDNLITHGCPQS
jgi:hypothetical protein